MLEVLGLRKAYETLVAVEDVSFRVEPGEVVGLLGPNGAGKTTTVSMISGLLTPDRGEVRIDGRPLTGATDPLKRKLGLVPQELALYDELTAFENLRFFGGLYDLDRAEIASASSRVLELAGLGDRAGDPVRTFSGGMKRRLNLAASLLHNPTILLLDEPTVGVDPQSRNAIFENLETLKAAGKSIVYTTHYMEEAERLCDRVVIVDQGKVVAVDTLRGLYARVPAVNRIWLDLDGAIPAGCGDAIRATAGVVSIEEHQGRLAVDVLDLEYAPEVIRAVTEAGGRLEHFVSERANLEAVFLNLTGRSLRDS